MNTASSRTVSLPVGGCTSKVTSEYQLALVETIEVDLEHTADMRFVVGMVVELRAVDLDRSVVSRWIWLGAGPRQGAGKHPDKAGSEHSRGERCDRARRRLAVRSMVSAPIPGVSLPQLSVRSSETRLTREEGHRRCQPMPAPLAHQSQLPAP